MVESKARKARRRAERATRIVELATPCEPVCIECGKTATALVCWLDVYRPRPDRPDLMAKRFWRCECGAFVGCHQGTTIPLGKPAGAATQKARRAAHAAFDPLWMATAAREGVSRWEARSAGYRWLAEQLGIKPEACHIAWMDAATAWRVVELCRPIKRVA